jgi:hypothetical protein
MKVLYYLISLSAIVVFSILTYLNPSWKNLGPLLVSIAGFIGFLVSDAKKSKTQKNIVKKTNFNNVTGNIHIGDNNGSAK